MENEFNFLIFYSPGYKLSNIYKISQNNSVAFV